MKKSFSPSIGKTLLHLIVAAVITTVTASAHAEINEKVQPVSGPLSKQTMSRLLLTDSTRSGNRIVAVGDRGYIVFSDSNGETWERAKAPTNLPLLNSVHFADANTAWAVGHDAVILKSTDKGQTWAQIAAPPKEQRALMDILFVDANVGFIVGAYGAFYETTDGGKSWQSRKVIPAVEKPAEKPATSGRRGDKKASRGVEANDDTDKTSDEDKHLNALIKLSDTRLFIAGEAGTLLQSNDNGKTWSRVTSPYKGSFFGGVLAADGALLLYGLRGNIFRANDASLSSWTQVTTNTKASIMGATKLDDGSIIVTGLSGTILISRDNGKTFTAIPSGTTKGLATPLRGGSNSILVVGDAGPRDVLLTAAPALAPTPAAK